MLLTPYASSSRGNAYQVYDGQTRILLECGLPLRKLCALLPHPLSGYAACLVTHEHKDHAHSAVDLMRRGIDVYMTQGTAQAARCTGDARLHTVSCGVQFTIGTLNIKPFATVHDTREPCGYLIHSKATGERLVFATDTASISYRFAGLTEIAVECNHCQEELERSSLPDVVIRRAQNTHMGLERLGVWLVRLDLAQVRRIWLVHLSASHANATAFAGVVGDLTGIETMACP